MPLWAAARPRTDRPASGLSPEARLLFLSAGGADNQKAMAAIPLGEVEWDRLLEMGSAEGAHPALGHAVRAATGALPGEAAARWLPVERVAEFRMRHLERRLHEALLALGARGIPVVLLKGAATALTVHRSFVARPMSDVDLLVRPDDVFTARSVLLDSGWSSSDGPDPEPVIEKHHLPTLFDVEAPRLQVGLELHAEIFSPLRNPFRLGAEQIWQASRVVEGFGGAVRSPDPHHLLLHCCLHYSWAHTFRKGGWRTFRDVVGLARSGEVDWSHFVELAREARGGTACYWSLRMAAQLARANVPGEVLAALSPPGAAGVLKALEVHFAKEALSHERSCPSGRLRKALWVVALRPRSSGHGGHRPWTGRQPLADAESLSEDASSPSRPGPGARTLAYLRYLGWMLASRAGEAGLPAGRAAPPPPASAGR